MRKIVKYDPPQWFEDWKAAFEKNHGRKASYKSDFPQEEKRRLRKMLLKEQGYICCYCMRRQIREVSKKIVREFGLDSFHLVRSRRLAVEASEVFEEQEYTEEEVRDIIGWYDSMDNGKYAEYCNAIIDVLKEVG